MLTTSFRHSLLIIKKKQSSLNEDGDMAGTGIMVDVGTGTGQICISPYPSPYPIEEVGDFSYPYSYPYLINAGIPRQNGDEFEQYL